jgi:hypothetical protein
MTRHAEVRRWGRGNHIWPWPPVPVPVAICHAHDWHRALAEGPQESSAVVDQEGNLIDSTHKDPLAECVRYLNELFVYCTIDSNSYTTIWLA